MKRRTLFGRLLVGAAAIVVAPSVKSVEAAPYASDTDFAADLMGEPDGVITEAEQIRGKVVFTRNGPEDYESLYSQTGTAPHPARMGVIDCETWTGGTGEAVTIPNGTVTRNGVGDYTVAFDPPITVSFKWMQEDCASRGCEIRDSLGYRLHMTFQDRAPIGDEPEVNGRPIDQLQLLESDDLVRVDTWRRSLHAEGG